MRVADEEDDKKDESAPPPVLSGRRKPAFAQGFPAVAELDALVAAFADGDFRRVREEAPRLEASTDDEAVKKAARTLRARTEPDPIAVWLLAAAATLLVFLSAWWIAKSHAPPAPPTSQPSQSSQPRAPVTIEHVH
jgi:hypothetical protein